MSRFHLTLLAVLSGAATAVALPPTSLTQPQSLAPQTTIPVTFTRSVSANRARPGDPIIAKTMQTIRLADGQEVRSGATVLGHVVEASPFHFDKTPYAKQTASVLSVQFDSLVVNGGKLPIHVLVRALADAFATDDASRPRPTDEDPLSSTTQVGGDIRTPSQAEILNQDGDIVGYNKHGGNFARLVAGSHGGDLHCDASNSEQAMGIFSASACGVYGFSGLTLNAPDADASPSRITLSSTRRAPEIVRSSSALLETLPLAQAAAPAPVPGS